MSPARKVTVRSTGGSVEGEPRAFDPTLEPILQELMDLAYWGPRGPAAGNEPSSPTFSAPDACVRIGYIVGALLRNGIRPSSPPKGASPPRSEGGPGSTEASAPRAEGSVSQ